jgi:parallel beta-helix repeat protein/predicted outer membrane repeat protein
VTNCTLTANASFYGGAMYNQESTSVLTNCTFGQNWAVYEGGAILNLQSDPTLTDCNLTGNAAAWGGGMYNEESSPALTNCTFTGNSAYSHGGGIYNIYDSNPVLSASIFTANFAEYGGGMANQDSTPILTNCRFTENSAGGGGGALDNANSSPVITGCTFTENSSPSGGGMQNYFYSDPVVTNCTFNGNKGTLHGGAIADINNCSPTITNCTFTGNTANGPGGGIYKDTGDPVLVNCTFSGNETGSNGGGIYGADPNTTVTNCILWGNTDMGGQDESAQIYGPVAINYSCVQGWTGGLGGTGNIGDDPNFVREPNDGGDGWGMGGNDDFGNLRLTPGSYCIDAGDNEALPADTTDLDGDGNTAEPIPCDLHGHWRCIDEPNTIDTGNGAGPIVDMGAYEYMLYIFVDDNAPDDPGPGDPDSSDPNEDGSQGHPFDAIQEAIDAAVDEDTIVVLQGTYTGSGNRDIDFSGKAIILRSTDPNNPDVVASTIVDPNGSEEEPHRGFYFHSGEDANSVLQGFTMTNGYHENGGGMYCNSSSPTLTNCTFNGNSAVDGGGMRSSHSSPTLTNCTFSGNSASNHGGGIFSYDSNPTLINCTFSTNYAGECGGGMWNSESNPVMTNCTFRGNEADHDGGGIFNLMNNSSTVSNCIFRGNSASNNGGGIYNYQSDPTVTNCTFRGNWANSNGGGMYNYQSGPTVNNCILWSNTDSGPVDESAQICGSGTPTITYCCVQGWTGSLGGTGNMGSDPLLTPDEHLWSSSPCIDSGDPNGDYAGQTDMDGEDRVIDANVDIGADEFADSDGDGLSNWWEQRYFGDPNVADANADSDGDGLTNLEEYELYSSNPNAPPYYVEQGGTIQEAIDEAEDGDTILVDEGTYTGPGNRNLDFGGKSIILLAPGGAASTIIDCNGLGRGFNFHSGETPATAVIGFTITNGQADYGGAIRCDHSHPQIRECVITGNTATNQGGGIYCNPSIPTFADCNISDNGGPNIADIWTEYGGVRIVGTVQIADSNWVGNNLTLIGNGTIQMDSGAALNLDESQILCNLAGPVTMHVELGGELVMEGSANIDLGDPCDPEVKGTIDCNGLLQVKDNVQITNANINVTRASFEDDANISKSVITVSSVAPYGHFFIEPNVTMAYNIINGNGDRYMDLDPSVFEGLFQNNLIYVTITEGIGQAHGGLFELRGDPNFAEPNYADPCCDPNGFMCHVDPCTIPECNVHTWTLERLELKKGAKLNLTNRFPFQPPYEPGSDYDVLYVKELILREDCILNTAFNWVYYGSLTREPNAVTTDQPLLGFSLINIAFDDDTEFIIRVTHNNYEHPADANYNRSHVTRIEGNEPDPNGMMQMCNIADLDPNSPSSGETINAQAKGFFAKASEGEILVTFEYMFIEDPFSEAELVVYLSETSEVGDNLMEVARIRPPEPNRPGAIGSNTFGVFSGTFPTGDFDFIRGTYIELELRGTGARCWINNWDPIIYCTTCGDFDGYGNIDIIDYLLLVAEFGLSPVSEDTFCLDLVGDGIVNTDDLQAWHITDGALNICPSWLSGGLESGEPGAGKALTLASELEIQQGGESESLLILGNADSSGPIEPSSYVYHTDVNGTSTGDTNEVAGNGRVVADSNGGIYQVDGYLGLIRLGTSPTVVVEPNDVNDGNNLVYVGFNGGDGLPLLDAAFKPDDANIVYVVPVLVDPQDGNCPYMAAAKLRLTGAGSYDLLKLYGKNPAEESAHVPKDCNSRIGYEPDVQNLHEIEIDSDGKNVFVLSANWSLWNNWVSIYDEATGNESEVRVWLSDPNDGEPNVIGPTAMLLSSFEEKLYLVSSVSGPNNEPNDLMTEVYRFSIDRTGQSIAGLTFENIVEINCPEPDTNICKNHQGLCDPNRFVTALTSMTEDLGHGILYVTGFTAPTFKDEAAFPAFGVGFFTTPMLAAFSPYTNGPVQATKITGCDLVLPLSIAWTGDRCGGANLGGNDAIVTFMDFAILASAWLSEPGDGNWNPAYDISKPTDSVINGHDLNVLAHHWLETGCRD